MPSWQWHLCVFIHLIHPSSVVLTPETGSPNRGGICVCASHRPYRARGRCTDQRTDTPAVKTAASPLTTRPTFTAASVPTRPPVASPKAVSAPSLFKTPKARPRLATLKATSTRPFLTPRSAFLLDEGPSDGLAWNAITPPPSFRLV